MVVHLSRGSCCDLKLGRLASSTGGREVAREGISGLLAQAAAINACEEEYLSPREGGFRLVKRVTASAFRILYLRGKRDKRMMQSTKIRADFLGKLRF